MTSHIETPKARLVAWLLYLTDTASSRVKGGALACKRLCTPLEHCMDSPAKVVLTDEGLGTLSAWLTDAIVEA